MIVKIPNDIRSYENKAFGNFTKRQIICLSLAFLIIAPSFYLLFTLTNSIDLAGLMSFLLGFPVIACSFFQRNGVFLEKIVIEKYKERNKCKQNRPFVMQNLYEDIQKLNKEDLLINEKDKLPSIEKAKEEYSKKHNNNAMAKKRHDSR